MPRLDHPRVLRVGRRPYQQTFIGRRRDMLLAFTPTAADPDMAAINSRLPGFGFRFIEGQGAVAGRLDLKMMSWVTVAESRAPRAVARDIQTALRNCWLASPVFDPGSRRTATTAAAPDPSTFIVELRTPGDLRAISRIEALGTVHDVEWSRLSDRLDRFSLDVTDRSVRIPDDGFDLVDRVRTVPGVLHVEFDWLKVDPLQAVGQPVPHPAQWNLNRIGMQSAWQKTAGDDTVWIAVIDTGFDLQHPGLSNAFTDPGSHSSYPGSGSQRAPGTDVQVPLTETPAGKKTTYDWRWHGTAVTGIIGGPGKPAAEIAGVAPKCKVLPIRVEEPISDANVARALNDAREKGALVVNFSISTGTPHSSVRDAVLQAWKANMVICAAAGNGVKGDTPRVVYPAAFPEVIAVGACLEDGSAKVIGNERDPLNEKWFSNYGPQLSVLAPSIGIWTTDVHGSAGYNKSGTSGEVVWFGREYEPAEVGDGAPREYFYVFTGTSAAVAHVSGLAGLLFSHLTAPPGGRLNERVRAVIEGTCEKLPLGSGFPFMVRGNSWSAQRGFGRISAAGALAGPP